MVNDFLSKANVPFSIDMAKRDDISSLNKMALAEDMGDIEDFSTTLVARSGNSILGFCRIRIYPDGAYVNPIVTVPETRGQHIGVALMRMAKKTYGPLKFVARGCAVPFYRSLGCEDIEWDEIAAEIAVDCDECNMYETCHPQPMSYR